MKITKMTKNVKNTQKCDECLMYKLFMIILTTLNDTFGTCWIQELPVNHIKWLKINKITWGNNMNGNTIPDNAVEAT